MPVPVPSEFRAASRTRRNFGALYSALVLLSFHWAVVLYINSSYLGQFMSERSVGVLYTFGSLVTIGIFLSVTKLLTRRGNYTLTLVFALLECITLLLMALTHTAWIAMLLFVVHQAVVPLILFHLDIFMEEMIGKEEGSTGTKRGLLLAIMSLTGALATLLAGYLVGSDTPNFGFAYVASALFLIPFILIIMRQFKTFKDPHYPTLDVVHGFALFWHTRDIRNVFCAHFLLQLFFSWMVMYTPIYLAEVIGFNWEEIGQIIFAGLMAYVFFEYVIGIVADRWLGEKEMMVFGFVIMAVSTSWFVFLDAPLIIPWMVAMFMTRVGASFV